MLKKGSVTFADLFGAEVKLNLKPVSVQRLSVVAAFGSVAANPNCAWFASLRPVTAASALVVCA
jgi:hypothetical protein